MRSLPDMAAARSASPGSERLRLARLAERVALSVTGVVRCDAGPADAYLTAGGGERVEGVLCTADGVGGYDVSVRIVVGGLVPLRRLADNVAAGIRAQAGRTGLPLGQVAVEISDLEIEAA